jgi:hypothetical protein
MSAWAEANFAVATEWRLWRGLWSFLKRTIQDRFLPNASVDLPAGMGRAIAITRQHEEGGLIVVTIIEGEG